MRLILQAAVAALAFATAVYPDSVISFVKNSDGVTFTLSSGKLRLKACRNDIVRVMAASGTPSPAQKSLAVSDAFAVPPAFSVDTTQAAVTLSTSKIRAEMTKATARLRFLDASGKLLVAEPSSGARNVSPVVRRSDSGNHLWQRFLVSSGEALYGLGQFQNAPMNYRNTALALLQTNTVSNVVPFLVSTKGYAVFWDNMSETAFSSDSARGFEAIAPDHLYDASGTRGGLTGEYFSTNSLSGTVFNRIDKGVDFDWGKKSPAGVPADNFSVRWTGQVMSAEAGTYTFRSLEDDGIRVWVNNTLVISDWVSHPLTEKSGTIALAAATKYPIKVEYYEATDKASARLEWKKPSAPDSTFRFYSDFGDQIDYYVVCGPEFDNLVAGYRAITGAAPLYPKWAYGFFQSRERYTDARMVDSIAKGFRDRKIPIDVIVQDWNYWNQWNSFTWDNTRYPDPAGMVTKLHDTRHLRVLISVWPSFGAGSAVYNELQANGSFITGLPSYFQNSLPYDPFSSSSRQIYLKHLNSGMLSKGVDAWWVDASEPGMGPNNSLGTFDCSKNVLGADSGYNGSFSRYLNAYTLAHSQGLYDHWRAVAPATKRAYILTRAGFAGQQRCASTVWTGDIKGDWPTFRKQIQALCNFSMAGVPYVATDIGGFVPMAPNSNTEYRELYTRWFQFGAFCPAFRSHGTGTPREMWFFGNPGTAYYDAQLSIDKLHYRLLPYIYSTAWRVTSEGYTLMRGLPFDFRADAKTHTINDQYMFGPAIMACPVTAYQATSRSVYLPAGTQWYNFWTGDTMSGGAMVTASAPISIIPLFIRAGSIIPMGPMLEYSGEKPADPVELRVYTGANGKFTLYEDEGDNYNYEKGTYATIPISWDEATKKLTINTRTGTFPGMLANRTFKIVWAGKNHGTGTDTTSPPDVKVSYTGTGVVVDRSGQVTGLSGSAVMPVMARSVKACGQSVLVQAAPGEQWTLRVYNLQGRSVFAIKGSGNQMICTGMLSGGLYLTRTSFTDGSALECRLVP